MDGTGSRSCLMAALIIKGRIKLSLCLTKYHSMKPHSLLNKAPGHGGVLGEWKYIAPRSLNLGITWR